MKCSARPHILSDKSTPVRPTYLYTVAKHVQDLTMLQDKLYYCVEDLQWVSRKYATTE